jgi:aminopeptidase N
MTAPGLSAEALLRDEAQERARLISNPRYRVELDLTQGDETFGCVTTVEFDCSEPGAATFIDLMAPGVSEMELNGAPLSATAFDGHRIALDNLASANTLRVVATCAYSRSGTGLHFFRDPVDDNVYLHTQFEAREAHKAFACFDQPDVKGTFEFVVTAPPEWIVISNTEPAAPKDGVWTFPRTEIMSTYITAIVAGPYHHVHDRHGDIPLGLYCRRSLAQYLDTDELFEVTKQGFDFFTDYFGVPYPFGKYDQLFVPEFNAGAMENAGCVTFNEIMVYRSKVTDSAREGRAETILHEMAHMWFGDLVTMTWWDDLWLNESFATYMATLSQARATRFTQSWVRFARAYKVWAMTQDQMPTTHPIVADCPDTESARTNFDGISYAKGASVLKQLVAWVGEEPFVRGLRAYFDRYAWGNSTLQKFLGALEEASGRDLGHWSKEWLETAGVNTLRARVELQGETYKDVSIEQTAPPEHPTLRSHRLAIGLYDLRDGKLSRRRRVEIDVVGSSTEVLQLAGEHVADLLLVNDDDLTYSKIRLDERSLATITDHLADLDDPLARGLCWAAAVDQLRDAELAARDFVRLVANNVHTESDPGTVQQLLALAQQAIVVYGDPANRDAARLQLAARALAELERAEPGSDLQLVWARTFINTARTDEHLAVVRGLFEGTKHLDGLAVDTDIRWQIVEALSGLGVFGERDIVAELERDPTDDGARHAAAARAGAPNAQAKTDAWNSVLDEQTPLATIRAVAGGFHRFDQADLLQPYVEQYFERLKPMWDERPVEVAVTFAGAFFPGTQVAPETIDRAERYIAADEALPFPIKRTLLEQCDSMRRALRGRDLDVAAGER